MTTQVDIANRALAEVGTRSQLTGSTISTSSTEGLYASLLYAPLRDFLLREGDYDFAMTSSALVALAAAGVWPFAYQYPSGALRIRQLVPSVYVALDPRPIEWNIFEVANVRQIRTNLACSEAYYTVAPAEDIWDPIFTEAFVRLLASSLAFALENRIEASQVKLTEAVSFAGIANLRDS